MIMIDPTDELRSGAGIPDFSQLKPAEAKKFIKEQINWCIQSRAELLEKCVGDQRKGIKELASYFLALESRYLGEIARVQRMYDFDGKFGRLVAGVDEVGRGPLAGPIVGAAVILRNDCATEELILEINDSKKISRKKREELVPKIKERALTWAIYEHSNEDIDQMGLSYCNNNIFIQALRRLSVQPDIVLSDGFIVRGYQGRNEKVIKGDSKSAAIACASIIAKVYRDKLMAEMDDVYPGYGFSGNVGYGSENHILAIQENGPCRIHRRSFLTRILEEEQNWTEAKDRVTEISSMDE